MFQVTKLIIIAIATLSISCQSFEKKSADIGREVSSKKIAKIYLNIKFKILFNQYVSLYKKKPQALDERLDKKIFFGPILQASKRAHYYLFEFDRKLDQVYQNCQKSEDQCSNSLNFDEYKKLIAYRFINEKNKESLRYFYLRLKDMAGYNIDQPKPLYLKTTQYINKYKNREQKIVKINYAKKILARLHQRADYYINTDFLRLENGATFYENALEIKLSMQRLDHFWDQHNGGVQIQKINLRHVGHNTLDRIRNNYIKNKRLIKSEVFEIAKTPEDEYVNNFLKEIEDKRKPQNEFLNISGRSFNEGDWALTYDDGPKASITNQILDTLSENNIHATFFNLAEQAEKRSNKDVLIKAKKLGMGLANHSYSHNDLNKKGADLDKQIVQANDKLEQIYADNVNYFRLPYGSGTKNSRVQRYLSEQGLYHFFWTVDSLDWKDPDPQSILERIVKQMKTQKKGIILLHDIRQRTADLTVLFADYVKKNNINIRPLSDILEEQGLKRSNSGPEFVPKVIPVQEVTFPHKRKIIATALNVRSTPDSSMGDANVCGQHLKGDTITVLSVSDGWYKIELQKNKLVKFDYNGSCANLKSAFISASNNFSRKN